MLIEYSTQILQNKKFFSAVHKIYSGINHILGQYVIKTSLNYFGKNGVTLYSKWPQWNNVKYMIRIYRNIHIEQKHY